MCSTVTADDGLQGMEVWMMGTGVATATLTPPGENNDIFIEADTIIGGVTIVLTHDATLSGDAATPSWNGDTSTLTIYINGGVTTAATVIEKINDGTSTHGLTASATGDSTDSTGGPINTAPVTTAGGADAQPVTWTITLPGADNDILLKGEAGTTYTGLTVNIVDNGVYTSAEYDYGSWSLYHAKAAYDEGNEILTIYIESGVTTREDVLKAIGTDDYSNEAVPFTSEAAAGEKTYDGDVLVQGVIGVTALTGGGSAGEVASVVVDPYGDLNAILFRAKPDGGGV